MNDFSNYKINCKSISLLMMDSFNNRPITENQERELSILKNKSKLTALQSARLVALSNKLENYNPNILSNSIKSELIKMYAYEQYDKIAIGQRGDGVFSLMKGTIVEMEAIKLLSEIDGIEYVKNEKKYSNKFIKGIPDIVDKKNKKVIDIKSSIDIVSFLNNIDKELSDDNNYQMKGYMELTKMDHGEVCFCLVNTPPDLINSEIRKEKTKNILYGKDEEYANRSIQLLQNSMVFDDIPIEKRVIRYTVTRDKEVMKKVYEKVILTREWLKIFHEKHMKANG